MKRKLMSAVLFLIIILCISGCGNVRGALPEIKSEAEDISCGVEMNSGGKTQTETVLYSKKEYLMPGGCSVRGVARIANTLMLYGYRDGKPVLGILKYSLSDKGVPEFGETELLALDTDSEYCSIINAISAGGDGFFYAIVGEYPPEYMKNGEVYTNSDYQGRIAILKYSQTGEQIDSMMIPDWQYEGVYGIAVDEAARVYIMGNDYVSSFEWKSTDVSTVQSHDGNMCSVALTSQGVVISALEGYDYKYYLMEDPTHLKQLTIERPSDVPTVETGNMTMSQGIKGEYIISANSRFLAFDLTDNSIRELYQWDYTAYPSGCRYACRLAEQFFACTVSEDFLLITGLMEQPKADRSVVNVALYDMGMSNAGGIVSELNLRGGQYQYNITEYGAEQRQRLLADIISGGKVDLVVFNNNLSVTGAAFDDLYKYIDNDADISRDDFIPGILEALSDEEHLYELWEAVTVNTIAAREKDVEGKNNISPWDYQDILEANSQYEAVFQRFMDKENLLKWIAEVGMVDCVDRKDGTCSFNNPEFAGLLSWCAMMGDVFKEGSEGPNYDVSQVILSLEPIGDPLRLRSIQNNFGCPYSFVGFPTGGDGLSYFTCSYNGSMAIPANSSNKEGAWAYIKNRLLTDAQVSINYGLPVNRQALLRHAEAGLSSEHIQKLLELLQSTKAANRFNDQQVKKIIIECGGSYLYGDKTLEETLELIQSRVSIYLSEQYG